MASIAFWHLASFAAMQDLVRYRRTSDIE